MNLSETDYRKFLDANQSLILYAGKKKKIVDDKLNLAEFRSSCSGELIMECANAFYDNPHVLRTFVKEGQIIGSAPKQKNLDKLIQELVPDHKIAWVYTFKM